MRVSRQELKDYFTYQIGALQGFLKAAGMKMQHVKMHGALLTMALENEELSYAMAEATKEAGSDLIYMGPTGTQPYEIAESIGLRIGKEAFADRAYNADKSLASRHIPGTVFKDQSQIESRIEELINTGTVKTIDGQTIELDFDTICLHGDTPGAAELSRIIHQKLLDLGVTIKPLGEII